MYRAKIPIGAALVLAALTAGLVVMVGSSLRESVDRQVATQVRAAQQGLPALDRLRGIERINEAINLSREEGLAEIFGKTSPDDQRQAAFAALQERNKRLADQGKKPDLLAVVGQNGKVISRDLNINAMYDEDLKSKYPAVQKALEGTASKDIWNFQGKMYHAACAPIRNKAGSLAGALVVGYMASARDAIADKDGLGADVAYFLDEKIQASSFRKGGGESAEEQDLARQFFKSQGAAASKGKTEVFRVTLAGDTYVAAAGGLSGNLTQTASGFIVLAAVSPQYSSISSIQSWVTLLGIAAMLAAVLAVVLTSLRYLGPLDRIESGVAEVINGNRDYVFESPGRDLEGLANGLNVMMARLLGRPDPTDDDDAIGSTPKARGWQGELSVDDAAPAAGDDALAQEPEAQYHDRLFREFSASRKQTGEGTDGLIADSFIQKIKQNEAVLAKKYNCRAVRFKVVVKNKQTTLKPVPLS